ncbi:MAG: hypothetical protein CL943_00115 [Candidatus Diapherotrites archaeon]|uniref:Aminopeptidase n=1 Tax=Candidatus Iainarchaeum sp. TaxID=3101447 RepID=A0A2D6LZT9_9ARCH|nr:hypothetical protein [Candidatus Diapherotrites archaeon]
MKYKIKEFDKAVAYYRTKLRKMVKKGNTCVVEIPLESDQAFYSVAPLSRAIHELKADMNLFVVHKNSEMLSALKRTWAARVKSSKEKEVLDEFIASVNKKTKSKYFEKLFKKPELTIIASKKVFYVNGTELEFQTKWFKKRKWRELLATCKRILGQGYNLRKSERFSVSFELIPTKKDLQLPLDDYLDNLSIGYAMALAAKKMCKKVSLGSSTTRMSQLDKLERISDLGATLVGCEYEKNINEPWFKKFKKVSKLLRYDRLKPSDAAFGIHGKGYGGKHFFGMNIGYPTPNRKSRWQGPGQMFLKPYWLTQSKIDKRDPKTRYAITETLPLENFIRTCYVDYFELRRMDDRIRHVLKQGKTFFVKGKKMGNLQTNLRLDMTRVLKKKSPILASDIEVNPKTEREASKIFKVNHGRYGNFPGGEVFWTPYDLNGTYVGDVVINVDQSYIIGNKKPFVVEIKHGRYKVKSGQKKIVNAFNKRKRDSWKMIKLYEKSKSMPKTIINTYKKNFDRVGEIAINTNPKAKISRYLIETEKLARMMHIALGSGYEPNRESTYHCDIVLNCPRQKVDMWVETPKGKEIWIMKKGKLVV